MMFLNKDPKSPFFEKIVRILIPAGLIYGGLKLWNVVAPTIITAAQNFWLFVAMAVPAAMLVGWVAMNPKFIWMWYLGMCKKVTAWFIKMDPLSIMDGYLAILRRKYRNLQTTLLFLKGKMEALGRAIKTKQDEYEEFQRLALAANKQGQTQVANTNATKALRCKETIALYKPVHDKYVKNTTFLTTLSENWASSIDTLSYTIDSKREEYETMKEMFKGLKSAEDFISSDSAEAQAYGMSLKALEQDVSQKIAYIDDFEQRSKPIMDSMKVQKQANEDDAVKLLEEMIRNSSLQMPMYDNYVPVMKPVENIAYEEVKGKYKL